MANAANGMFGDFDHLVEAPVRRFLACDPKPNTNAAEREREEREILGLLENDQIRNRETGASHAIIYDRHTKIISYVSPKK